MVPQNQFTSSDVRLVAVQLNSGASGSEKKIKIFYLLKRFIQVFQLSKFSYLNLCYTRRSGLVWIIYSTDYTVVYTVFTVYT